MQSNCFINKLNHTHTQWIDEQSINIYLSPQSNDQLHDQSVLDHFNPTIKPFEEIDHDNDRRGGSNDVVHSKLSCRVETSNQLI